MIKPRTEGERRAFVDGVVSALNDVDKLGLEAARHVWQPMLEAELELSRRRTEEEVPDA